ncbi:uncharacterized protein LOC111687944 [Lucilia cuprina]|uniref:uncharacterized protein LOC111687944 n=1 Tax=Lucilia cuprina TaxID=7375 RepID=UPI000C71A436|nr:uncharacterized protein LOC111687944 [Lucilia cuprina]KAI8117063.1 hypothetical protein CVS40_10974 [Lucilia cuprina]
MTDFVIRHSGYKRTTDKQYSLLTHEMSRFSLQNRSGKKVDATKHWNNLTEKLNALGPPYRTIPQWKKVWTDFRRFHSKRGFKSKPKFTKSIKKEPTPYNQLFPTDVDEGQAEQEQVPAAEQNKTATSSKVAQFLRSEWEEYGENSQTMNSTHSNEYADEYSYPDRHSSQVSDTELHETLIPDESPYDSYTYTEASTEETLTRSTVQPPPMQHHLQHQQTSVQQQHHNHQQPNSIPPPLQPANTRLLDQTLYTLQNQMEHQTKLLEHLSQISSTMASLMERQVLAVEKQTEAMRRQASATEHHTLVMNNFVDMIRDKMPKTNSKTTPNTSANLANGNS